MNRIIFLSVLLALLTTGCTSLEYAAGPQKPVLGNSGIAPPHRILGEFVERGHRVYLFWGLLPVAGRDGTDLIQSRMASGDGIINLTARERYSFLDELVVLATVGIVSIRTVEVRGDTFAYEPAPGELPPPIIVTPPPVIVTPPSDATPPPPSTDTLPPPPPPM